MSVYVSAARASPEGPRAVDGAREFRRQAEQFARDHGSWAVTGGTLQCAAAMELDAPLPALLERLAAAMPEHRGGLVAGLAVFTHGTELGLQAGPSGGWIRRSAGRWAAAVAPFLCPRPVVALFACGTGGRPPSGVPFAQSLQRRLTRELRARHGVGAGACVWGHTGQGHPTASRTWRSYSPSGCADVVDSLASRLVRSVTGEGLAADTAPPPELVPRAHLAAQRILDIRGHEGPLDPLNLAVREIPFLGVGAFLGFVSTGRASGLDQLGLTPEATARLAHGLACLGARFQDRVQRLGPRVAGR